MSKTVRNTLFTAVILSLTALGVNWNVEIAKRRTPLLLGQSVLAEFSSGEQKAGDLALNVELSRQSALLGQFQVITIETAPFASLDLALMKPDGSFEPAQTFRATADELGRYNWRFRVDNFRLLGRLTVMVRSQSGAQTSASRTSFSVQTWNTHQEQEDFNYPLLP